MKYRKSRDFIEELNLAPGQNWRGDCYACGGTNTLSITNIGGVTSYHCFRASCKNSGSTKTAITTEVLERAIRGTILQSSKQRFVIPEYFVEARTREEVLLYLASVNSLEAYLDRRVEIMYDPRQHRAVFMIKHEGEYYGAVGRSLDSRVKPKWFVYGNSGVLFRVQCDIRDNMEIYKVPLEVALVEDCASCCSSSHVLDSIALLGTNLAQSSLLQLAKYDTVYICLDKDATSKSIEMHRTLSYYVKDVQVRILERDLKYLSKEEINDKIFGKA